VSNFLPVSLTPVKLSKTVKVSLTGVVDTGEELLTGVNDTSNACFAGVVDTGEAPEKSNISANIRENIEIISRLVYWDQEKLLEEKTRGEKSGGTVPLSGWF
jgi:hypothetical protein